MDKGTYHAENVAIAIQLAIKEREKYEREVLGYTMDSGLVAGWRQMLEELKRATFVRVVV